MPVAEYTDEKIDEKANLNRPTNIFRLKKKNEKIIFALADARANMIGRHWINNKPHFCDHINKDEECYHCNTANNLYQAARQEKDKERKESLMNDCKQLRPKINFYYKIVIAKPKHVLEPVILETVGTVYQMFKQHVLDGVDITEKKWEMKRTEQSAANYYTLDDKGEIKYTPEITEAIEEINSVDIDERIGYTSESKVKNTGTKQVEETINISDEKEEEVSIEDVPFG